MWMNYDASRRAKQILAAAENSGLPERLPSIIQFLEAR
jgi:hypothetical protein